MKQKKQVWKAVASFLIVLLMMPLGHAFMILMEHALSPVQLHYGGFLLGAMGLFTVVFGVFVKGDTKQTLCGLFGGLLFWTGWVEFLLMYYAQRYGTLPQIDNGTVSAGMEYVNGVAQQAQLCFNGTPVDNLRDIKSHVLTRPEYLILPSSFGFWAMFMLIYLFSIRSGCKFFNWCQSKLFGKRRDAIVARPMTRHTSIVTFMELNMILWTCYLLLMFCYDENFLGVRHPLTIFVGVGCFVGAVFIFLRQLRLSTWGANLRMSIASVIVFWTPVEILGRMDLLNEIWVAPLEHTKEMGCIFAAFLLLAVFLLIRARLHKHRNTQNSDKI